MKTLTIAITPAQFAEKEAELNKDGISITGNTGEIKKLGVDVNYSYDGRILTINVLSKPFFTSEDNVESKIKAWFATPSPTIEEPAVQTTPQTATIKT